METLTSFLILILLVLFDYKTPPYIIECTVATPHFSVDEAVEMEHGGPPLKAL